MKFKHLKFLMAAMAFLVVLAACDTDNNGENGYEENGYEDITGGPAEIDAPDIQIALIAHSPDSILDDGSFNQGAWDGIQRFAATHNLPDENTRFFQPHTASDEARLDLIEEAIAGGANVLVLPGHHFATSLYDAQVLFPDTTFILLDATPAQGEGDDRTTRVEDNLAAVHYAEEQAGFLAGYAAVMEGYRELGFMGGIAVPAVVRFGHGFIQGAEHAAAALDLAEGDITINFMYLGGFAPEPAHTTTAASWYAAGTEVIFAAAGGAGGSVMSAAEAANASVIGVDVDQAHLSNSVVISAIKGLDVSVYDMLTDFMNDTFRGGIFRFEAANNGIGLSMDSSRLNNFTQEQYNNIFEALRSGEINVNDSLDIEDIQVSLVTLIEL